MLISRVLIDILSIFGYEFIINMKEKNIWCFRWGIYLKWCWIRNMYNKKFLVVSFFLIFKLLLNKYFQIDGN